MRLLQVAYENQYRHGIDVRPGWKHCSRMVCGSLNGSKLMIHSSRLGIDSRTAILYADILAHEGGSAIVGEFKVGSRIFFWMIRAFLTLLFLSFIVVLLLGKLRTPESLPTLGLSITIVSLVGVYLALMYGLNKNVSIAVEDVKFVRNFIETATAESHSHSN